MAAQAGSTTDTDTRVEMHDPDYVRPNQVMELHTAEAGSEEAGEFKDWGVTVLGIKIREETAEDRERFKKEAEEAKREGREPNNMLGVTK